MTERKQREITQRRTSLGFVVMLLFSTLGVLATVPVSSANLTGFNWHFGECLTNPRCLVFLL